MIIEPLETAAVRPQSQGTGLTKIAEPEPSRPIQGTAASLDSGLDVNRDLHENEQKIQERDKESDPDARTYDAKGNTTEPAASDSPPKEEGTTVDLFV